MSCARELPRRKFPYRRARRRKLFNFSHAGLPSKIIRCARNYCVRKTNNFAGSICACMCMRIIVSKLRARVGVRGIEFAIWVSSEIIKHFLYHVQCTKMHMKHLNTILSVSLCIRKDIALEDPWFYYIQVRTARLFTCTFFYYMKRFLRDSQVGDKRAR